MDRRSDFWTILLSALIFAAIAMWSEPGFPATPPPETTRQASVELGALDDLGVSLRREVQAQERRLASGCDFAAVRERLIQARDEAIGALQRLAELRGTGRLRGGGMALSEVLVDDVAALIDRARRDTAVADTLALLQDETRGGSAAARVELERLITASPAGPACLSQVVNEQGTDPQFVQRALERILFIDYGRQRLR